MGAAIAIYGWFDFQQGLVEEHAARRERLMGLAQTMTGAIEPDIHQSLQRGGQREDPRYRKLSGWLRQAMTANDVAWIGSCVRDNHGHWTYVLDGSTSPQPIGYPLFDGIDARDEAWDLRKTTYRAAMEDEWGSWDTAFAPIMRGDEVVGVLEVAVDAESQILWTETRGRRLAYTIVFVSLGALLLAFIFARRLSADLGALTVTARRIASGDLSREVHIHTHDEIGVLAHAFNEMIVGLRERDTIRDTFGRFVDPEVVTRLLANKDGLRLGGEARVVSVVMSDLRGFTALSQALGAEAMVALLNRYFSAMGDVIAAHHGTIGELVGDGIVTFFGAPETRQDDARRAVACAIGMQQALVDFNHAEQLDLEMGIGIDTGEVIAGNIGSQRQMKYGVVGDAINLSARLESFTVGNQILISQATLDAVGDDLEVGPPRSFQPKGRTDPLVGYVVFSLDDDEIPVTEEVAPVPVAFAAVWWAIEGKQVAHDPHPAEVIALAPRLLVLRTPAPIPSRTLRLSLTIDGEELSDIYATVASQQDGQAQLHLTSIPDHARDVLLACFTA